MNQQVVWLLQQVAARQRLASLGRWFYLFTIWLAGAYALILVFTRVSSLIPDWYTPPTLLLIVALAMALAVVFHRQPTLSQSARAVDWRTGAKDVFLTATMIENAPGEYKPLVLQEAAKRAAAVQPETVVPFRFWPPAGHLGAVLLALLLAIFVLPRFDPFGRQKELAKEAEKRQLLDQSIKEVSLRAAALESHPLEAEQSQAVDEALKEVKQTFSQMKPKDPAGNLQQLNQAQEQVGEMWKKAAEEKLKESLDNSPLDQKFGAPDSEKTKQWEQELKEGKTDSMQKEAKELQSLAERMQNETNPAAKAQEQQEMQKRLQEMSDFVNSHAGKEALKNALAQAQQQLSAGQDPGLSSKAMAAMAQSMSLTQDELKSMAQSMRDLKSLQAALDAIEAAKSANSSGNSPDGKDMGAGMSMADYAKFFKSMGKGGNGSGFSLGPLKWTDKGGNSPQQGLGRRAAGDPNAKMGFQTEKDNSQLTAGKTLLEWNEKGMSASGAASKDYAQSVKTLKEGVSEAILKEEIPPGYHDQIEKYFDDMVKATAKPPGAGAGAAAPAPAAPPPAAPSPTETH